MSFLYPSFLYGLLALSIPLVIHLFNFRKTRRVYFSNTSFLKKVKETSTTRRKLKHYLILLSRLAFIFFLIVAFAQPFLPAESDGLSQGEVLIYLDNSMSMGNETSEGMSLFDAGVGYVEKLTEIYPMATTYKLLTNDFGGYVKAGKTGKALTDMTTEISLTGAARTWKDIRDRLLAMHTNAGKGTPTDVYWISDFQRSTAGEYGELSIDSNYHVNLVPLSAPSRDNVSVDSLYLDNPFLIGNERLKLNVVVRNRGSRDVKDLVVKVYVDEVQSATASLDISPNGKETAVFDLAFDLADTKACRVSFEEYSVTFDNDFYFAFNDNQRINVLEIRNTAATTPVAQVYSNEKLFNFSSYHVNNLDYSLMMNADMVVVNGLPMIDVALAGALNRYMNTQGTMLFIPAASPEINSYRQLTGLGAVVLTDTLYRTPLATPDLKNPFFANVFEEANRNFVMPEAVQVLSWGIDRTALLKYSNGIPFLSKKNDHCLILAAPLETSYTGFHLHAVYVPVMYQLAIQAAGTGNRLYYYIDDPVIRFRVDTLTADPLFKFVRGEKVVIPAQRVKGNEVVLEIPKDVLSSGFYDLNFEGEKRGTIAFNTVPEESALNTYTTAELKKAFRGNITLLEAEDLAGFEKTVSEKYIGDPLWKYAIVLALTFLLLEVLLIRFLP